MYCRHCNVKVDCTTDVCPLCGQPLEGTRLPGENPDLPSPIGHVKKRRLDIFSKVYIPLAAAIIIACVVANVLTNPAFMWSIIVMVSLTYVYYCVRFTFIAQGNFIVRVFGQTIALTIVFILMRLTVGGNHWVFITWLPIVYFLNEVMICVYLITTRKVSKSKLSSFFVFAILGVIPVCAAYILDLSVKWPSIAATAVSVVIMIILIITNHKQILSQIRRYFHI